MEKFIPYEKLSKKDQKKRNAANRTTWGDLKPVTRRPDNPKAYNRSKARKTFSDFRTGITGSFFALLSYEHTKALKKMQVFYFPS